VEAEPHRDTSRESHLGAQSHEELNRARRAQAERTISLGPILEDVGCLSRPVSAPVTTCSKDSFFIDGFIDENIARHNAELVPLRRDEVRDTVEDNVRPVSAPEARARIDLTAPQPPARHGVSRMTAASLMMLSADFEKLLAKYKTSPNGDSDSDSDGQISPNSESRDCSPMITRRPRKLSNAGSDPVSSGSDPASSESGSDLGDGEHLIAAKQCVLEEGVRNCAIICSRAELRRS
jgi:hypothetical protein